MTIAVDLGRKATKPTNKRERSGSVIECLSRDRVVVSLSKAHQCKYRNQMGLRRFGTSKMHLSPPPPPPMAWAAVRSKAVVLLLLTFCLLLLPLWESVIFLCFVVRYFMSILVLQSS